MKTAVITTGGLGTRLLTCTKVYPKTMLPIYDYSDNQFQDPMLRPLLEIIFENLFDLGFRRFCFIIGSKTKTSIYNHMKPDKEYIKLLIKRNVIFDKRFIRILNRIYRKLSKCEIKWIIQHTPMGFGDALLRSRSFVGNNDFLLHAGDTYFPNYQFMKDFINRYQMANTSASLLLQQLNNTEGLGIAQLKKIRGENIVFNVKEKPKHPSSNWAIVPIYIFKPNIFNALIKTPKGHNSELQVTDAVKTLIDEGEKIIGYNFGKKVWFDIGTPQNYYKAITYSFKRTTA